MMFTKKYNTLLFLFFAIALTSCNIINPAEPVPSYLKVDSFSLAASTTLGSTSNKIADVYVYVDTKFQGAYPIGSTFPILESGSHEMLFYPGIALNGIANTREPYPFYEPLKKTVDLKSGEIKFFVKMQRNVIPEFFRLNTKFAIRKKKRPRKRSRKKISNNIFKNL